MGFTSRPRRSGREASLDLLAPRATRSPIAGLDRSSAPRFSRGFRNGLEDLEIRESIVIYPGQEAIPIGEGTVAMGLHEALEWIRERVAG